MSVKLNSSGGGSVTLQEPSTATNGTLTLPAGTGTVAVNGLSSNIVSGTAVASTSGTSIDFTGIPSWVKRITVMFSGVSTSGTSNLLVQVGNSTPTTSGYVSVSTYTTTAGVSGGATSTAGMVLFAGTATNQIFGSFTLVNISGNIWVGTGITADTVAATFTITSSGRVSLASALNMLRITTVNGTDTFDAGSINILYE
jgi:hypothetical protein